MNDDFRAAGGAVKGLLRAAGGALAGTFLLTVFAGLVLAGLSYYWLQELPAWYGALAAVLTVAEATAVGVALGGQRAVGAAAVHGLLTLRLGGGLVRRVFDHLPAAGPDGAVAHGLARLPLAQAEDRLRAAVRAAAGADGDGGWLLRVVRRRLLAAIGRYTLSRFRADAAAGGGVDILKVRAELERAADEALARRLAGGLRMWTTAVAVGLPAVVAGQTWALARLARAAG